MAQMITIFPDQNAGPIPSIWRPSVMYGNSTLNEIGQFQAIPGPIGVVRLGAGYLTTDFTGATDLTDFGNRVRAYCAQDFVREIISRGTGVLELAGMPRFLSSSADTSSIPNSGVSVYRTARAADLTALQTAMQTLVGIVMNEFGYPAPRNPQTGAVEIGRPGVVFELFNETASEHFWGWEGVAVGRDFFDWFKRAFMGGRAANANAVFCGPSPVVYNDSRVDKLWATSSSEINISARVPGGTEGTGRASNFPLRTYWKFDASKISTGIASVSLQTNNTFPSGTISSDAFTFRRYGTNGQGNPDGDALATAYANCVSGATYVASDTAWRTNGVKTINLGATAVTDLNAARLAGGTFTVTVAMDGEGSGANRFAVPLGFDSANRGDKPFLQVTYNQTWIQQFLAFCSANACPPDVIIIHNFQTSPELNVSAAAAHIQAALTANGLPTSTPMILTEFQNNGGPGGVRDDYKSAAYLLGSIYEHGKYGFTGICMASLIKQSAAPVDPDLFYPATPGGEARVDNWGMITNGTQNGGFFVGASSFMAMRLFSLWQTGNLAGASASEIPAVGYRQVAMRTPTSAVVAASRWAPGSFSEDVTIQPSLATPGTYVRSVRVHRFGPAENNPAYTFQAAKAAGGSYASWCTAAQTAAAATVPVLQASRVATLSMLDVDSAVVEFEIASLPQTPPGALQSLLQDGSVFGGVWEEIGPHGASQGVSRVGLVFSGMPVTPITLHSATLRMQVLVDTPGTVLLAYARFGVTSPLWSTQSPPPSAAEMNPLSAALAAGLVFDQAGSFIVDVPLSVPALNAARSYGWGVNIPWDGRFSFNLHVTGGTVQVYDNISELYVEYTTRVFTGIELSGNIYRVSNSRADICPLCGDESLRETWHWDPRRRRMECAFHTPDKEDEPNRAKGSYRLLGED